MTERILGPTGSPRRRRWLAAPVLMVTALALLLVAGAQAVHDDAFQLDGETTSVAFSAPPNSSPNRDWDDLFNADGTNTSLVSNAGPFTSASFQRDFGLKVSASDNCSLTSTDATKAFCTADTTTFATGSKDTLDISGWQCNKDNNVNSKIDIMNAYAAAYTATNGDKIMYFGMEKNKDNGTNNVAFWFLQGDASCVSTGPSVTWSGLHRVGDVLVVSEFSGGGGVSTVTAYKWVGGANPLVPFGQGGDCKTAPSGNTDSLCATTNATGSVPPASLPWNQTVTTKWLTADATLGVGNKVVSPDFFEGGINLTKVFSASGQTVPPCFSTFIGDTRSSTSLTATLFDFTRGRLGGCESTLTTKAGDTANGGIASPTSIGSGSVSSGTDTAALTISGTSSWGGTMTWYLCGPDSTLTTCDKTKGVLVTTRAVSSSSSASDFVSGTATLTSAGKYCWTAHFEPDAASKAAGIEAADDDGANECFTVAPVTPTLDTDAGQDSPVSFGSPVSDTATLSGAAKEPGNNGGNTDYPSINATNGVYVGTISFTLKGPDGGTPACSTTDAVALAGSTPTALPITRDVNAVTGNGQYGPVQFTPNAPGDYHWVATYSYSGTAVNNNLPVTHNADCSDSGALDGTNAGENVNVLQLQPTMDTAQRFVPNDSATVSVAEGAGNLQGNVRFKLYVNDTSCSGAFAYDSGNIDITSGTPNPGTAGRTKTVSSSNTTAYSTTGTTFSWLVTYVTTNQGHKNVTSTCNTENSSITIDNGAQANTP